MTDAVPPKPFPPTSLVGVRVPNDFNAVVVKAAAKNGVSYEEQLLAWAQAGAECQRLNHAGRKT